MPATMRDLLSAGSEHLSESIPRRPTARRSGQPFATQPCAVPPGRLVERSRMEEVLMGNVN